MVLPDSRRMARVPRYSGTMSRKAVRFRLRGYNPLWRVFSGASPNDRLVNFPGVLPNPPTPSQQPPCYNTGRLGVTQVWALPVSLAATQGIAVCFLFLRVLRCFNSPGLLHTPMYSVYDTTQGGGFSHSEIVGSKLIRSSPTLIAAYHVLHRLLEPRHPRNALNNA